MMTMTISRNALNDKRLNSTDKLMLGIYARDPKINCSKIAKILGCNRQGIWRQRRKLLKLGVLK